MPEFVARAFVPPALSPTVRAYLETAEWCGIDEEDRAAYREARAVAWTNEALVKAREDCEDFLGLLDRENVIWEVEVDEERLGTDFWLTRNRHGAGFWDRGQGKLGETLTKWAHTYSEQTVQVTKRGDVVRLELV